MRRRGLIGVLAALPMSARADDEPVVAVIHKDNPNAVDLALVRRAFVGLVKAWPDGSPLRPFDQPEDSEVRAQFCQQVLHKSLGTVKAIWAQNIFTGKGYPPKVLASDAEVRRVVAADRQALGYLRRSQLDDSVREVLS